MTVSNRSLQKNQQNLARQSSTPAPISRPVNLPQAHVQMPRQDLVIKEAQYVDLKKSNEQKKFHMTYLALAIFAGALFYNLGKNLTEQQVKVIRVVEIAPPPAVAVAKTLEAPAEPVDIPQAVERPQRNTYESRLEYDKILTKYSVLEFNLEQQRDTELAEYRRNTPRASDTFGSKAIYNKYRSLRTDLNAKRSVELCDRIGYECDQANDYKNFQASNGSNLGH